MEAVLTEGHNEVKLIRILERKLEGNNEWVIDEGKNSALSQNVCNFTRTLSDMSFTYCLQSIDTLSVLFPDLHDLAETALPNDSEEIECFDSKGFMTTGFEIDLEMEGA